MYVFVSDKEPDHLTDSLVKLDTLADTQESFSTSHHRIALEYDEDTVSLVVDLLCRLSRTSIIHNRIPITDKTGVFIMHN